MLNYFYKWCIFQSASPMDKYQKIWTLIEEYWEIEEICPIKNKNSIIQFIDELLYKEDIDMVNSALEVFYSKQHLVVRSGSEDYHDSIDFIENFPKVKGSFLIKFTPFYFTVTMDGLKKLAKDGL